MASKAGGRAFLKSRAEKVRRKGKATFENATHIFGGAVNIKLENLSGEQFFRISEVFDEIIDAEKCKKGFRHFEKQNRRSDVVFRKNANHLDEILSDRNGLEALDFGRDIGDELFAIEISVVATVNKQIDELIGFLGIGIEEKFANKVGLLGVKLENQTHVEKTEIPRRVEINVAAMRITVKDDGEIMKKRVEGKSEIVVDGASDVLFVVGGEFEPIDGRVLDKLHHDNIIRAEIRKDFRRSDFNGVSHATVDAIRKLTVALEVLTFFQKVGFLINPIDIIFEGFVAAEKIAKLSKTPEAMNEAANLFNVVFDAARDVRALDLHGDDFTGFKNSAVDLGNGGRAEWLLVDGLEDFVERAMIFLFELLADF